jgi:hypothetical protein
MSWNMRATVVGAGLLLSVGCSWDGVREKDTPNRPPTVEITGGAVEGRNADYRVEFFWFGSDPDGAVDHFLVAIDDTCLCTIVDTLSTTPFVVDTTKSFDVDECLAAGLEPAYDSPDSIWQRVDAFSGSFDFEAENPIPSGPNGPFESQAWHTFYIKAIDDRGAQSQASSRYFNAITIAPTVRILAPVGQPPNNAAQVSPFFNIRWSGRDEDSSDSSRKPVGYQLKMVPIFSVQATTPQQAIDALTNEFVVEDFPNVLIPDSLVVPVDPDTNEPLEAVTDSTYLPWDWYPKRGTPYPDEILRFQNATAGDFSFGIRPVDQAGAVMPRQAFRLADNENAGNVIKMDINPNLPVNPYILVDEKNLLGTKNFTADGEEWRVEVPVNLPLDFEWMATADHYGGRVAGINFALDIADPGCEVCQSSDGIGGWIGWGSHEGFGQEIIFTEDQAGEQHILYIRARDESFSAENEILAVIIMDVISFDFDRTALLVDDFIVSGYDDCRHDDVVNPMVRQAIEPYLQFEEELEIFAGHAPGAQACSESSQPTEMKLSTLARYKLLYWPVSGQGSGSVLGSITQHPNFETDTERYLSIYMQAGGSLIVWGRNSAGHLLGDFFPQDTPYEPELPQFSNPEYGPGTFLWDVMQIRSMNDVVGRSTSQRLSQRCSGIIGMEATQRALNEGYPAGRVDPTGYVDLSGVPRTAIWYERYVGENNPFGSVANCVSGPPALRVAGMDTLYTYVSNSWTYEAGGADGIREACGTAFPSSFEDKPVVLRYEDPFGRQGKYAWLSTPLYVFAQDHTDDLHLLMSKLTSWIFD